MKLLEKRMEIGLEINAIADDALGTPLHAACFNGHDEVVWHLLAYRIELELDVDFYNGEDETPYQVAKARNHINVVKAFDFYRLSNEDWIEIYTRTEKLNKIFTFYISENSKWVGMLVSKKLSNDEVGVLPDKFQILMIESFL